MDLDHDVPLDTGPSVPLIALPGCGLIRIVDDADGWAEAAIGSDPCPFPRIHLFGRCRRPSRNMGPN